MFLLKGILKPDGIAKKLSTGYFVYSTQEPRLAAGATCIHNLNRKCDIQQETGYVMIYNIKAK